MLKNGTTQIPSKNAHAYATLLTRPTYLPGAVLLAHTLLKHSPSTPLIILYTPETLPSESIKTLEAEARYSNLMLREVEHLRLREQEKSGANGGEEKKRGMVAARFADTWTKLRVFDVWDLGFEKVCFLDADMMVFRDPSGEVFGKGGGVREQGFLDEEDGDDDSENGVDADVDDMDKSPTLRLMATHVCVCNLDHDAWAPTSWTPSNCVYTHLSSSKQIPNVDPASDTLGIFNTGTFVFRPSRHIANFVSTAFKKTPLDQLHAMKFPDQDFLNQVFRGRWESLAWSTNALKTWRYWHPNIWRDDEVAVLHYIVDKPWAARVQRDDNDTRSRYKDLRAGYLGKDGVTHMWWWEEYERWVEERREGGEEEMLGTVGRYVAARDGEVSEEMRVIGAGSQDLGRKWKEKRRKVGEEIEDI